MEFNPGPSDEREPTAMSLNPARSTRSNCKSKPTPFLGNTRSMFRAAVKHPVLRDLVMYPGVLQPLSSGHFGRFLHNNPQFYAGKRVLDVGCGSGALGIIMAKCGADHVVLSDIDENCCANTHENVHRFGVEARCEIIQSDLFAKIKGRLG